MPRTADFSNLNREDLLHAVNFLVATKAITPDQVRAAADRARKIADLERQIAQLKDSAPRRGPGRPPKAAATKAAPKPARRKPTATPALQAARVMQGKYLGRLRKLQGRDKQKVKAAAKNESVAAAVKLADKLLGAAK